MFKAKHCLLDGSSCIICHDNACILDSRHHIEPRNGVPHAESLKGLQNRLMAQQATTGKNLSKRIEAAHNKYLACADEVVQELHNSRNHTMRAAFVVFNEPFLADAAVEESPRGMLLVSASLFNMFLKLHKAALLLG